MKCSQVKHRPGRKAAFTLLEALLLVTILGICGAAAGVALKEATHSPEQNNNDLAVETSLLDKMEYLHALPFTTLAADVNATPSSFTDSPTIAGVTKNRVVQIVYIFPTTGTTSAIATHMLQMTVTIDTKSLTSMMNQP